MNGVSGFTLIEISIVLVVVGLIIGGVVLGQAMVLNFQMRKLNTQMTEIETAINTFQGKYNCTPGDCIKATSFSVGTSGDGDTMIDGSEKTYIWEHLSNAGFLGISPDSTSYKTSLPNTEIGIANNTPQDSIPAKLGDISDDGSAIAVSFIPQIAYQVDNKFDDGIANASRIQAGGADSDIGVDILALVDTCTPDDTSCCEIMTSGVGGYSLLTTAPYCTLQWSLKITPK